MKLDTALVPYLGCSKLASPKSRLLTAYVMRRIQYDFRLVRGHTA